MASRRGSTDPSWRYTTIGRYLHNAARKFDARATQLGSHAAERLQDWRRLRQARHFLDFLVMMIRADLDPKEKA